MLQIDADLADNDRGDHHRPAPPRYQQQGRHIDTRRGVTERQARAEVVPRQLRTHHVRPGDHREQARRAPCR